MERDVSTRISEEACGLLAEVGGLSVAVFPATNIFHSPSRYQIDPFEQMQIFKKLDENHWKLMAIYHSHPFGPPELSHSDVKQAGYPETAYLLWWKQGEDWLCRGYAIDQGQVRNLEIITLPE